MKRLFFPTAVILWILVLLSAVPVSAAETLSLHLTPSGSQVHPEQTCQISLSLRGDPQQNLAGAQLSVEYDESRLTLQRILTPSSISSRDFKVSLQGSSAVGIYATATSGIPCDAEFATLVFKVNEDAPPGSAQVDAAMDSLINSRLERVPGTLQAAVTLSVAEPISARAFLERLVPSAGTLEPAFSPEHTEYTMTVPYEVESLQFELEAGEQGSARVNRKNLNRAGTPTVFTVTVTAADGKTKQDYTITVHRLEQGKTPSSGIPDTSSSSRPSTAGQTVSSKTTSQKSSSSRTGSSKTSSSKGSTAQKNVSSKTSSSSSRGTSAEPGASGAELPGVQEGTYSRQYLPQNRNRMPGFLLGILCGSIAMLLGILIVLLLAQRHRHPKKRDKD